MLPSIDAYWQSDQVRFCTTVSAGAAAERKTAAASVPGIVVNFLISPLPSVSQSVFLYTSSSQPLR